VELTDAQKQAVSEWVAQGAGLADVQSRLSSELGITATFMDVRFLVIDLGLELKEAEGTRPEPAAEDLGAAAPPSAESDAEPGDAAGIGTVSVEVDRVMKPGSVVSGSVTFSDGVTASWALDQLGRLAISADREGYRPSEEDLGAFQQELQAALERKGF